MSIKTRSRRPPLAYKKRGGKHHRHSKLYVKTYWPYLPMLLIVIVGLAINSLWNTHAVLGSSSDFSTGALLTDTNAQRELYHEQPLTINRELVAAAQNKANDMVKRNYWSHNTPDGKTPWTFINAAGYQYQAAGENLAYGFDNAADAITGWMNSPEHRANILDANYQNVGFGVASSPDYQGKGPETVVVAEYGNPAEAAANVSFTVPQTPAPQATGTAGARDPVASGQEIAAQPVSRIQLLTGGKATWSLSLLSALTGAAVGIFLLRHWLYFRRLLSRSELYVVHHPWIDVCITLLATAGFILTRTSGLIR